MTQNTNLGPKTGTAGDQAVSITSPNVAAAGFFARVSPFGALAVAPDGQYLFSETFEGVSIDTTNRWATTGTVVPTQSAGQVQVNPAATASATSALQSKPSFTANSPTTCAWAAAFESGTIATGNHRFMGFGTPPTPPGTSAAPLQDAVGFEIDTTGTMNACVYASGTRTFAQPLSAVTDGASHKYVVIVRGDLAMFFRDTFEIPLATSFFQPTTQVLPVRFSSLNSGSVTGTPTMVVKSVAVIDAIRTAQSIQDGTYPWRRAKVNAYGDQSISITSPAAAAAGISVGLNSFGALNVSTDAITMFNDPFDSGTIDSINRWNVYGTVAPSQTTGLLILNPSTTASATVVATSQPTFSGASPLFLAWEATIEAAVTLGNHRFMGWGVPSSQPGTSAAPLYDAVGFEIDTAGVLQACVYAAGVRVFNQALTRPVDGGRHTYAVVTRGNLCMWYLDTFDLPLANTKTQPMASWLPIRFASLNSASVTVGTPTFTVSGVSAQDQSRSSLQLADGTYPWRKAQISRSGGLALTPAPALPTHTVVAETATGLFSAGTRKDYLSIEHAAVSTKTLRVLRVAISGYQTTALVGTIWGKIFYGTAATSAGTVQASSPTNAGVAAAEAVCKILPTVTAATLKYSAAVGALTAATANIGFDTSILYDSMDAVHQPLTLRQGQLECLCIALYSNVAHNITPQVTVIFSEE